MQWDQNDGRRVSSVGDGKAAATGEADSGRVRTEVQKFSTGAEYILERLTVYFIALPYPHITATNHTFGHFQ